MKKFRCPYCKALLGEKPQAHCPRCGKSIVVPGHLRGTTLKEREKLREKIARNAERQRREMLNHDIRPGRNPIVIGLMLMVLIIVGGLVVGRSNMVASMAVSKEKRIQDAEDELRALRIAVERFRIDCGRYPSTSEGLKALVINPGITNWGGNYVNIVKPDPWLTIYSYKSDSTNLTLFSCGPDKQPGTEDDIVPDTPTKNEIKRKQKND